MSKEQGARAKYGYSQTFSIGDYEFIRVDLGAEVDCGPAELSDAWDYLETEVDARFDAKTDEVFSDDDEE